MPNMTIPQSAGLLIAKPVWCHERVAYSVTVRVNAVSENPPESIRMGPLKRLSVCN